jgi:hypothetical protein
MRKRFVKSLAVLLALSFVAAACGGDDDDDVSSPPPTSGEVTGGANGAPEVDPTTTTTEFDLAELIESQEVDYDDPLVEDARTEVNSTLASATLSSTGQGGYDPAVTEQYISGMVGLLDSSWSQWMISNNYREPEVYIEVIQPPPAETSFASACGVDMDADYPNAGYCPDEVVMTTNDDGTTTTWYGALLFPSITMARMWSGNMFNKPIGNVEHAGDFAAGYIVAHEFGHHIVDEFSNQTGVAEPGKPNSELLADCFAGVGAYSLFLGNYLETGDLEEAVEAAWTIGDFDVTGTDHHGTPAQRVNAFLIGYSGTTVNPTPGHPGICVDEYWR